MAVTRKSKEAMPVLAICYDFDKTLSPDDMQAQGYIQAVYDGEIPSFWRETNEMAESHEMDSNLAYMYKMVRKARGKIVLTRRSLEEYGSKVKLFPGADVRVFSGVFHYVVRRVDQVVKLFFRQVGYIYDGSHTAPPIQLSSDGSFLKAIRRSTSPGEM